LDYVKYSSRKNYKMICITLIAFSILKHNRKFIAKIEFDKSVDAGSVSTGKYEFFIYAR
jgi:hypothetical protein